MCQKSLLWGCLVLALLSAAVAAAAEVNGDLVVLDGIPVLRVWGSPYEMGYAQGLLMAEPIRDIFVGYLPLMATPFQYNLAYAMFDWLYFLPDEFVEEARGLLDGALAAGMNPYVPFLGRDVNEKDVAVVGASADLFGLFGCSSLIAWGERTAGDPELAGEVAVGRNLDWSAVQSDPSWLARQSLVVARTPSEGRSTISVGFPGFLGCLSCMNDAGVSALQHQSWPNPPLGEMDFSQPFLPINLAIRQALEQDDVDGDGVCSVNDVVDFLAWYPRSSAYNVIVVGADYSMHPPVVLELRNSEVVPRYDHDEADLPAGSLAATNHLRKLANPSPCSRYATILTNVAAWDGEITLDRLWENCGDVEMANEGEFYGDITAQTMIFIPKYRRIGVAFADQSALAPEQEPVWLDWSDVFGDSSDDDIDDDSAIDDDAVDGNGSTENGEDDGCGC